LFKNSSTDLQEQKKSGERSGRISSVSVSVSVSGFHSVFIIAFKCRPYLQGQKKSDWRKKREDFIATLRAAKEAQRHLAAGGSLKDLPPPPPMDTSDYIQCPHCTRR
jgi:hypothetical protein